MSVALTASTQELTALDCAHSLMNLCTGGLPIFVGVPLSLQIQVSLQDSQIKSLEIQGHAWTWEVTVKCTLQEFKCIFVSA